MSSILELLRKGSAKRPAKHYTTLDDGVVDLTSDTDEASEQEDIIEVVSEAEQVFIAEPEEIIEDIKEDSISCPVCQLDIAKLTLEDRESHVELCLLKPSNSSFAVARSPKKKNKSRSVEEKETEAQIPRKQRKRTRPLPDFKILTLGEHTLIVDGFSYADGPSKMYFLTHFHSDHYGGLFKNWAQGTLYCSQITADLAINMFNIPHERFVILPMDTSTEVQPGLHVTLYDANHCPGAVLFLFETDQKKILHTGDFRVSKKIIDTFKDTYIDEIYLDTTYLNPVYTFYDQRMVIDSTTQFINDLVTSSKKKKRGIFDYMSGDVGGYVIIVGSYSIGKEKIYLDIAKALNTKIFVTERRYKTLKLSGMDMSLFEKDKEDGCLMYVVSFDKLTDKAWLKKFSNRHILKVRPTGWTFSRLKRIGPTKEEEESGDHYQYITDKVFREHMTQGNFEEQLKAQLNRGNTLSVPYSEHSSFKELSLFGTMLKWGEMIPTVSVENQEFPHWFKAWKEMEIPYKVLEEYYQ